MSKPTAQSPTAIKDRIGSLDRELHAFLDLAPDRRPPRPGTLAGLPIAVKNNTAVKGFPLTCASRMLEHFMPPEDATAVRRVVEAGGWIVGTTNLDEFAMGSSTRYSSYGPSRNPWNPHLVPGGSSGGSAVAVAAGMVPVALGSDTGGSVRQPAAFCGIYGIKPTWGAISRSGLVSYASSLDQIGVHAASLGLLRTILPLLMGPDPMDQTCAPTEQRIAPARVHGRIAVLQHDAGTAASVCAALDSAAEAFSAAGYECKTVDLRLRDLISATYFTIATAEASANLARYDGIRYGARPLSELEQDELVRRARRDGFGPEVRRRVVVGTHVLRSGYRDRYYRRAQQARAGIRAELTEILSNHDALMLPVYPVLPFPFGSEGLSAAEERLADRFTCLANLAGLPAMSVPFGTAEDLPTAVQLIGAPWTEDRLMQLAGELGTERKPLPPPGYQWPWEDIDG